MRKVGMGLFVVVLLFLSVYALGVIAEPQPRPEPQAPVSPLMTEIQTILTANDAALAKLQQRLDAAPDEVAALAILREIGQQKQDTEIAILRTQQRYAQQAGNQEAVDLLTRSIENILNPQPAPISPEAKAEREARRTGGQGHD